jgi:hypothetical protein
MKDKNGVEIKKGDAVDVPEPSGNDMHSNEFRGYVDVADNNGTVIVLDGDGDAWEFEPERLEVQDN